MVKLQFYIVDVSYETDLEGVPVVQLFGRTTNGKKVCVLDEKYRPYFYVITKKDSDTVKISERIQGMDFDYKGKRTIINTEVKNMKYLGEGVGAIKVEVNHLGSIDNLSKIIKEFKEVDKVLENDILFSRTYLFDKKITPLLLYEVEGEFVERPDLDVDVIVKCNNLKELEGESFSKPRILAFDIEAYTKERRYPVAERDPIIMVSFKGNDGFEEVITWKKFKKAKNYVKFVKDESELIKEFNKTVKECDPDYLVGYFSDGFDFPYLNTRAGKNEVKLSFSESNLAINKRGSVSKAKIKGIVHLDVFKFFKGVMGPSLKLDNYGLGNVAREILNLDKLDADMEAIGVIWDNASEKLGEYCEYNLQDSRLALELTMRILPNLEELTKLISQPMYDVCRSSYSQLVERYLMKRAKEFNEIIPNRPKNNEVAMRRALYKYEGAFVFEPKAGLYEKVAVFDFQSMYPSIIVSHNICRSTLSKEKKGYESPEINIDGRKVKYHFITKREGLIPIAIRDVITRRARVKEMLKKGRDDRVLEARDYALKTVANAAYGYFGFFGARWYCRECAEAITAFGRKYIKDLIDKSREKGFEVIYSDTDSIFIVLGRKSEKDALEFLDEVNKYLPSLMEISLEDFYKRGIFVSKRGETQGAKKKYALISKDDRIKVRGFETLRRDWSLIAREVQKKVLEILLKENSPEKAYDYVRKIIDDIKEKKIDIKDMVIRTQLKKSIENYELIGPHVEVAKKMRNKGIFVGVGSVIKYVVTEGSGRIRDRASVVDDAKSYDADYYINNQILPAVERIFDVLGYKKEDLISGKEQSKLGDFQ